MQLETKLPSRYELNEFSVDALGLVDAPTPPTFDSITRLALRLFQVPVALISIVQEENDRQFFLSQQGLSEPWARCRQTPLSHSFCQHVKRESKPLRINDARQHPLVQGNPAIAELGVESYLGVPISMPDGTAIGSLCIIGSTARTWTDEELASLTDLASCVNDEILLRAALVARDGAQERTRRYNAMRESVALAFMAPDLSLDARFEQLLRASCDALKVTASRIVKFDCGLTETLFSHDNVGHFSNIAANMNLEVLTRAVASDCAHVHFHDLSRPNPALRFHDPDHVTGSYAGSPLIFNGAFFGVIEFSGVMPRDMPWTEEELSILSIVSMLATAHLGVFNQISTLQVSEKMLLEELTGMGSPI